MKDLTKALQLAEDLRQELLTIHFNSPERDLYSALTYFIEVTESEAKRITPQMQEAIDTGKVYRDIQLPKRNIRVGSIRDEINKSLGDLTDKCLLLSPMQVKEVIRQITLGLDDVDADYITAKIEYIETLNRQYPNG